MGVMKGMQAMGKLKGMQPLEDMASQEAKLDTRVAGWVKLVGEERAQAAADLARQGRQYRTLPELLAEMWLRQRSVRYVAQFDLGWAKPDYVLFDVAVAAPGAMVWEINGEYWHKSTGAKDASRKQRLLATTVRGQPVMKLIEVWEADIYQSDAAFENALMGVGMRGA